MPNLVINDISVNFPFEPYDIQKNFMSKVIECLQNGSNGVLESPTGTGKTLSLLCSSLGWLMHVKSKLVKQEISPPFLDQDLSNMKYNDLKPELGLMMQDVRNARCKIIYASRTHSQLSQAMQELKNTSYSFMHAVILGSREQLCIHPEVTKYQDNAMKTTICREKVKARSCTFHSRVEKMKDRPEIALTPILDIEDLVTVGNKLKACPYYLSKEMVDKADILFMPYNYILDPKARKANNLDLHNSVIILDEAHNVEKMCEESGSAQLKTSDVALAIEDTTHIMNTLLESGAGASSEVDDGKNEDFTIDDVVLLKEILLNVEKTIDEIPILFSKSGHTESGSYIYSMFEKANIKFNNINAVLHILKTLVTYIATMSEGNKFSRRGAGMQAFTDFLEVVYAGGGPEYIQSIEKCFKVHIVPEEVKKPSTVNVRRADGWTATKQTPTTASKGNPKIVNFWCFNPGFGMRQLLGASVRSIILTSGTLAPLKPLISELNIPVQVCLENPHIIDRSQVYVRVLSHGPDRAELNSSFNNRDNPQYLTSLGRTVLALCPLVPGGLLIFFPSYTLLNRCSEHWQASGNWAQIQRMRPIFVEPRGKDAFTSTMNEYYAKLAEPGNRGAIFMAVCRGKVSEGLDFADANGRAVMITGLPFPPIMDPRVILKKKYLDANRTRENEMISGTDWYGLEASRAVNQAIGRVIRHKNDYGAILLCDTRFQQARHKAQLSSWIQHHLLANQQGTGVFGTVVGELSRFFRNQKNGGSVTPLVRSLDVPSIKEEPADGKKVKRKRYVAISPQNVYEQKFKLSEYLQDPNANITKSDAASSGDFLSQLSSTTHTVNLADPSNYGAGPSTGLVTLHNRERNGAIDCHLDHSNRMKKRRLVMVPTESVKYPSDPSTSNQIRSSIKQEVEDEPPTNENDNDNDKTPTCTAPENRIDFLREVKRLIDAEKYKMFLQALAQYNRDSDFFTFKTKISSCFAEKHLFHLLRAMRRFVKKEHKEQFDLEILKLTA